MLRDLNGHLFTVTF